MGTAVDLTGYFLSDKSSNLTKWQIPTGASVPANGYLSVFFFIKFKHDSCFR